MKIYKLVIVSLFLVSLASCSDFFDTAIELDVPKHESKLAITTLISNTTGTSNEVLVSYSIGGLEDSEGTQLVNDANITLSYEDVTETFSLTALEGVYTPDNPIIFTPNTTYTLDVDAPGYPNVSATQTYPESVEIISASVTDGTVKVKFSDIANQNDYYLLTAEYFKYGVWNTLSLEPFGSSSEYGAVFYESISFNDAFFDGTNYEILASHHTALSEGDTQFRVKLSHVTEDFYRYDRTYEMARWGNEDPFVEPVILHRNIENGYGIFAMMNETIFEFDTE